MTVTSAIPARLDRLPWSRFHTLVVVALGITWLLDGLEVTLVGAISGVLEDPRTLHLSPGQIGAVASFYLTGAVAGALLFGWMTDRWGRHRMFYITLAVYLAGVALSAFAWSYGSFALFRALTGAGIGGEYAAINSAIDELMPARLRGRLDLAINGTYWLGAAAGAGATVVLLDPRWFAVNIGWRLGFFMGAALGVFILLLRRLLPESPRWLLVHGRAAEAEAVMAGIESTIARERGAPLPTLTDPAVELHPRGPIGLAVVFGAMLGDYRARAGLAFALMVSQAFLYNALFFTYALILTRFYGVGAGRAGIYLLPLAAGNFLGPLLLGRWFDTWGRRVMIAGTYLLSAVLLALAGWLFAQGWLTATTQTVAWAVVFFFASAAASSAYLTASEIFPLEMRALALACFYAIGTAVGGIVAPWLFGTLIGIGTRSYIFAGYLAAAVLMAAAAVIALRWGVDAEGRALEAVAAPLSAVRRAALE
ncbi:MAG TPA: MFS transporter [Terriglobales bacterium]|nr:MFS transporter [Terriglobales bacterium]